MSYEAWKTAISRFSYETMGAAYLSLAGELRKSVLNKNFNAPGNWIYRYWAIPYLPVLLVRPVRKIIEECLVYLKMRRPEPFLYNPPSN